MRRLKDEGTHLNSDDATYWFGLPPNLNRRVAELAAQYEQEPHVVDEAIEHQLRGWQRERATFVRVHGPTTLASEIPDEPGARLAVLGPQVSHRRKNEVSDAVRTATAIIGKYGESDRRYKNCIVFLAADTARLDELRAAVRRSLAWSDILNDAAAQELTGAQKVEAERRRRDVESEVDRLLKATWCHGLVPERAATVGAPIEMVELRVEGGDSPVTTFARKLESEGKLATVLGGPNLRIELDEKNLWRRDDAIPLHELYEYFAQYPYLMRLRDESVLRKSVQSAITFLTWDTETFAYADAYDASKNYYVGLVAGSRAAYAQVDMARGLVVKAEVAKAQFARVESAVRVPADGGPSDEALQRRTDGERSASAIEPSERALARHYFQRVTVGNATDLIKVAGQLSNDIVYLLTSKGAHVDITIEVSATLGSGIEAALENRLRSNSAAHGFGDPEVNS